MRLLLSAALLVSFAQPVHARPHTPIDDRQAAILSVLDELWGGWERGDRTSVEANLATGYVDTDFDGARRGAAEVLSFFQPGSQPRPAIEIATTDHRFAFHGDDVGVVTYRAEDCRTTDAGRRCFRFAATDTMVLEAGRWKLAAGQQSLLPADAEGEADASRRDVLSAETAGDRAQIETDADSFGRLTTDDWTSTAGSGGVVSKAKFQADMRSFWKPTAIVRSNQDVRLLRDGAVVAGDVVYHWRETDGSPATATERYTDVYVRQYGAWRKTRTHGSCVSGDC